MKNIEESIQSALVHWCKHHECELLHNIFHIPNGGYRNLITARKLKGQGVVAGVPDLCLPLPCGRVFWLEIKTRKGRLSEQQKRFHAVLSSLGHDVETAYGFNDGQRILEGVISRNDVETIPARRS